MYLNSASKTNIIFISNIKLLYQHTSVQPYKPYPPPPFHWGCPLWSEWGRAELPTPWYAASWVGPGRTHPGQMEIPLNAEEDTEKSRTADYVKQRSCLTAKDKSSTSSSTPSYKSFVYISVMHVPSLMFIPHTDLKHWCLHHVFQNPSLKHQLSVSCVEMGLAWDTDFFPTLWQKKPCHCAFRT